MQKFAIGYSQVLKIFEQSGNITVKNEDATSLIKYLQNKMPGLIDFEIDVRPGFTEITKIL